MLLHEHRLPGDVTPSQAHRIRPTAVRLLVSVVQR